MSNETIASNQQTVPACPDALKSHFPIGDVNEPIVLYSGRIDFTQNGVSFTADGHIQLEWLPFPAIRFDVPVLPTGTHPPNLQCICLRLNDGTEIKRAQVTGMNVSVGVDQSPTSFAGTVQEPVVRPLDGPVNSVNFLLPNVGELIGQGIRYPGGSTRAGRLVLKADGWHITLDSIQSQKQMAADLEARSGFGVTYIGRLERENGQTFKSEDAIDVLSALAWYISFAVGRWTGPCLSTGYDSSNKEIWSVWNYSRTTPFRLRRSWLDSIHGCQFENAFPGYMKLWLDEDWQEVIRVAIHWYVEANSQAGSIEGSIVLTQTAFELLSSAVLVERHAWLSNDGYEKLAAFDRIRLLYLWSSIPTSIPVELTDLTAHAKADNWPDTPTAMTLIRNTITHPTKKNREKFGKHSSSMRAEVWRLGLWYLELCLLRLFEYRGSYANRLRQKFAGEVEQVPWA